MVVQTTYHYKASAQMLWPLLFNSKMDSKQPCYLLCGLPKPVECRIKDGLQDVGGIRECVSDKGTIQQRITEWDVESKLSFELVQTDLYFKPCIRSIKEQFELKETEPGYCRITRTTTFITKGSLSSIVSIPMFIGLKAIHRYVFKNWERLVR